MDGNFSLFLTTVSNSLRGTNYVLWHFIKYSCPPPPALSAVQEASKWPGRRRISFPPRHNLQRQQASDKGKGRALVPEQAEGEASGRWTSPLNMSQDIRGFIAG